MPARIRTIDAHVGGAALRLIVEGAPPAGDGPMAERLELMRTRHDALRRTLMREPRGHGAMSGAILTPPASDGADAGVLFMHAGGWSALCGHGLVAVATIALERGLVAPADGRDDLRFDTAAGPVRARAARAAGSSRVERVAWSGVPAFVVRAGVGVRLERRTVPADVAHAAETYAIVDAEACGVPLDADHLPELARAGRAIAQAVEGDLGSALPAGPDGGGVAGAVFTGPPAGDADLMAVTIYADGAVDRSPGGVATCAVLSVLDAMGLASEDRALTLESLIGTRFTGRVAGRAPEGDPPAIIPEIEAAAFITGEHTFLVDEDDPLRDGFVL